MSSQFYSSGTYNSPVKKEDYERKWKTEQRGKSRKGKRRRVFGGAKGTLDRKVMAVFTKDLTKEGMPLILDPETTSQHQLQNGISADGIPIKKFLPNKTFHIRPYSRSRRRQQMATMNISNNADPAVNSVDRRKKIAKSPSMPNIKNVSSGYSDRWTKLAYTAKPKDLVGPHTDPELLQQRQERRRQQQKLQPVHSNSNISLREQYNPRAQKPIDEPMTEDELKRYNNMETNEESNNDYFKTIAEIYDEAHIHAKSRAEYPFEPDFDEAKLLNIFLQRKRRQSCPLLPIVPAAPGKGEMPNVPNDAFFLVQALKNREIQLNNRNKRLDSKTRKAVEAINQFSRNEQRRGTANVATYSSRRIFGIGEYKKLLSPMEKLSQENDDADNSTTFMTSNKLALRASLSGSDILNIDGEDIVVPKRSSTAPISAPRSDMSLSVSITTRRGSESISQGGLEENNIESQIFNNSLDNNISIKDRNIYVYISSSIQDNNAMELDSLFTNVFPTLNHQLKEMKIHLHPIALRFNNNTNNSDRFIVENEGQINKDAANLKLYLNEVKESTIVIALRGQNDNTQFRNPIENFVSKDPYMNHFVSNTLSSSSPTAIDIELKYAMDLGKYIFAYCKKKNDKEKRAIEDDALDSALKSYSSCRFSTYDSNSNGEKEQKQFEMKVIEDLYHKLKKLFNMPEKDPYIVEKEKQSKFISEKSMNSFNTERNIFFIEKLEAANDDKPTMILGDPESGRSSSATSIYDYYKHKEGYATIFFSSQATRLSKSVDQMLRYLIFQVLVQDGEEISSQILRGDISTLKLYFVMVLERYSKKLLTRGLKLVLIIDGLDSLVDAMGYSISVADWLPQRMPSNVLLVLTSDKNSDVTNWVYGWFADHTYTLLTEDIWLSMNEKDMLQKILKLHDVKWKSLDIALLRKTVDTVSPKKILSYIRLIDGLVKNDGKNKKRKDVILKMPRRSIELGFEIISMIILEMEQFLFESNIRNIVIDAFDKASIIHSKNNDEQTLSNFIVERILGAIYVSRNGLEINEILRILFIQDIVTDEERVSGKRIIRWLKKQLDYFIPNWNGSYSSSDTSCYQIKSKLLNATIKKLYASSFQSQANHYNNLSKAMHILKEEDDAVVTTRYLLDMPFYQVMSYNFKKLRRAVCSIDFINQCMMEDVQEQIGIEFQDLALNLYGDIIQKMSANAYGDNAFVVLSRRDNSKYTTSKLKEFTNVEINKVRKDIMQYFTYFQSWIAHNGSKNKQHMTLFGLNFPSQSPIYMEALDYLESLGSEARKSLYTWINKPENNAVSRSIFTIKTSEIVSFHTNSKSNLFVTGHFNGHLFLFEKASGEKVQSFVFDGHRSPVTNVFMLHFGMFVASIAQNTLILWETSTATTLEKTKFKKNLIVSCCGNANNKDSPALVTCTEGGEIICWYLDINPSEGNKFLRHVEFSSVGESSVISSVSMSPDSKFVGVGLENGFVQIWEVLKSGLKFKTKFRLRNQTFAKVIAFNRNSEIVLVGDKIYGCMDVYKISGEHSFRCSGHIGSITSLSWAEDELHIVSSGSDGKTLVWDANTYACKGIVDQHHDTIISSGFVMNNIDANAEKDFKDSNDDTKVKRILTVDKYSVKLINKILKEKKMFEQRNYINYHWSMPLKNKSIGNYSSSIQLNNSVSSQSSKDDLNVPILDNLSLRLHQRKITCTSFSSDSSRALSGCAQGAINVWSYESGETLDILSTQVNDPVSQVQFSPTDKFILAGFNKGIIRLWNGTDYTFFREFEWHTSKISAITFSKNSEFFVSGSVTGVLQSWNTISGKFAKYASNVSNGDGNEINEDDLNGAEILALNNMHKHPVELLILTRDETSVISCSRTGELRVFSVNTFELLYVNTDFQNLKGYKRIVFRYKASSIPSIIGIIDGRLKSLDIKELVDLSKGTMKIWHEDLELQKGISTIKNEIYLRFKSLTDAVSKVEKETLLEHVNSSLEKLQFKMNPLVDEGLLGSFVDGNIIDVCNRSSTYVFTPTKTTVCIKDISTGVTFPVFESYGDVQSICFHPQDKSILMVGDDLGNVYILRNNISSYEKLDEPGFE